MSNRDLLKSFITATEEFRSFYDKVYFQAGSWVKLSSGQNLGEEEEVNKKFRSGCDKDYFVFNNCTLKNLNYIQSDLIGIYKWQYKQYVLNLKSKMMLKKVKKINNFYDATESPWLHRQKYKKLNLLKDILISAYDIKSRQWVFKFNPFVLLEERKNYSLTISRVKEGVIKPLPF